VALITFQPGKYLSVGALLVLASSALYALHAALVKRHGEGIPFLSFFTFRLASASLFLLLITSARGSLSWPSLPAWGLLLFTSTVGVVFNRALYYAILNRVSLSVHSVILAATPVSAVTWGALLLRTTPSARELLGGVVVIAGVLLTTLGRRSTQMSAG
jgi:drug/metabolite transporter (DMT)-like permease